MGCLQSKWNEEAEFDQQREIPFTVHLLIISMMVPEHLIFGLVDRIPESANGFEYL